MEDISSTSKDLDSLNLENFGDVYLAYHPWVRRFFSRVGYSPLEAEDLTQETFLRVFQGRDAFRGGGSLKSFIFAVASNTHRNEVRRRSTNKRNAIEESIDTTDGTLTHQLPDHAADPLDSVLELERKKVLSDALGSLPPGMRRCVELRAGQGLKYREIAEATGLSIGTVKAQLNRAREALRQWLGNYFEFFEV